MVLEDARGGGSPGTGVEQSNVETEHPTLALWKNSKHFMAEQHLQTPASLLKDTSSTGGGASSSKLLFQTHDFHQMSSDFKVLHTLGKKTQCFLWDALIAAKDSSASERKLPLHFLNLQSTVLPASMLVGDVIVYQGKRGSLPRQWCRTGILHFSLRQIMALWRKFWKPRKGMS